jgi:hypothetical protein
MGQRLCEEQFQQPPVPSPAAGVDTSLLDAQLSTEGRCGEEVWNHQEEAETVAEQGDLQQSAEHCKGHDVSVEIPSLLLQSVLVPEADEHLELGPMQRSHYLSSELSWPSKQSHGDCLTSTWRCGSQRSVSAGCLDSGCNQGVLLHFCASYMHLHPNW